MYRLTSTDTRFERDVLALRDEARPRSAAEPLLQVVMESGRVVGSPPSLPAIRERCARQVAALPETVRRGDGRYSVDASPALKTLRRSLKAKAEATIRAGPAAAA